MDVMFTGTAVCVQNLAFAAEAYNSMPCSQITYRR